MTALDKALEIFDSFYDKEQLVGYLSKRECKIYAIRNVENIIEVVKKIIDRAPEIHQALSTPKKLCVDILNPELKFWQEVIYEIEKL